jgi:hypothetical protein
VPAARDQDDDRDADGKRKIHGSAGFSVGRAAIAAPHARSDAGRREHHGRRAVSKTDYGKRGAYLDPLWCTAADTATAGREQAAASQSLALSV